MNLDMVDLIAQRMKIRQTLNQIETDYYKVLENFELNQSKENYFHLKPIQNKLHADYIRKCDELDVITNQIIDARKQQSVEISTPNVIHA